MELEFFELFFSADFSVSLPNIKGVFTVSITPMAVFLIEFAVSFTTDITVLIAEEALRNMEKCYVLYGSMIQSALHDATEIEMINNKYYFDRNLD